MRGVIGWVHLGGLAIRRWTNCGRPPTIREKDCPRMAQLFARTVVSGWFVISYINVLPELRQHFVQI